MSELNRYVEQSSNDSTQAATISERAIRKVIYTTNAIESVNMSLRLGLRQPKEAIKLGAARETIPLKNIPGVIAALGRGMGWKNAM